MTLVVLGWGNETRRDDGLGPYLLGLVEVRGQAGVVAIEDYQLQIEHALDLEGAGLALFVDAGHETPAPFTFKEIAPRAGMSHTSHGLSPESLLDVYVRVVKKEPPPSFVLCVRGEDFELGIGFSEAATACAEAAWKFIEQLLENPDALAWRSLALSLNRAA